MLSQYIVMVLHQIQTVYLNIFWCFLCLFFLTQPVRTILRRPELAGTRSNVRFDQVMVFSFPRCQGFTSVPSHGGATLGMMQRHSTLQRYTLAEHALEQQHRRMERLRKERFEALKHKVSALNFYNSLRCLSPLHSSFLTSSVDSSWSPVGPLTREKRTG